MKQRFALRISLAMITVVAALASLVSGGAWIAGALVVCAVFLVAVPFAKQLSPDDIKTLLESLRLSQQAGAPALNAVVTSAIIFIGKSPISGQAGSGYAVLFRDEIDAPVWREMATLLRHQAHPSPKLRKVGQSAALQLGKSSDL